MKNAKPPGWGSDSISDFLASVHSNHFASFANQSAMWGQLAAVNGLFLRVQSKFQKMDAALVVPALFFIRCHSTYLGALNVALGMQVQEVFPMARSTLENAGYAIMVCGDEALTGIWLKQGENDETRKAARTAFMGFKILEAIKKKSQPLGDWYEDLYRRCIEFGAHPTSGAIVSNLGIVREGERVTIQSAYTSAPGPAHHHAISTLRSSAFCALRMFEMIFPDEFKSSGVGADIAHAGIPKEPPPPEPILSSANVTRDKGG